MILYRKNMPQIDLHGEDRINAIIRVKNFIDDNYVQGNTELAIIHGIGTGILRKEIYNYVKKDKRIIEYSIDMFNPGCCIIRLNKKT